MTTDQTLPAPERVVTIAGQEFNEWTLRCEVCTKKVGSVRFPSTHESDPGAFLGYVCGSCTKKADRRAAAEQSKRQVAESKRRLEAGDSP